MVTTPRDLLAGNWLDPAMRPRPTHLFTPDARYHGSPRALCGARPRHPREQATVRLVRFGGKPEQVDCEGCLSLTISGQPGAGTGRPTG